MKIIFFGSSSFSIPVLKSLLDSDHEVVAIVTTPDRKQGRGQKMAPNELKTFALSTQKLIFDPPKLNDPKILELLEPLKPDFLVIASYGKIIPENLFRLPKLAALNVHPSLLPKYRGASPIQSAILNGDVETGVSVAEITEKLDSGDIFGSVTTSIFPDENAFELSERLSGLAAELLESVLLNFLSGKVTRIAQEEGNATYAKKIEKQSGRIDWNAPAFVIHNQVRAFFPWPSSFTFLNKKRIKVVKTGIVNCRCHQTLPVGSIVSTDENVLHIVTGSDCLLIYELHPEGSRSMTANEFLRGYSRSNELKFSDQ